ncbi:S53 family peptidase [Glaciihabitans sp. GrIS 2.15]|uniref:S53 family peptidase n=1 Tax=Glaciihabitans sp. GrIS 2.15 TaxID=3071710 RepID=UPI002E05E089|nr:kumamolisin [Glaciihabitans sp. GrIS 2.15]
MSEHEETPVDLPLVPLPGSNRHSAEVIAPATVPQDSGAEIEVTVILRRQPGADTFDPSVRLSREDFAARMGADAADVASVTAALSGLGLRVLSTDLPSRRMRVAGTTAVLSRVFGTHLEAVTSRATDGTEVHHRNRTGMLMVPASLDGIITAVLGLDDRPQARAQFRVAEARAVAVSYTPLDLAEVYHFPAQFDGSGQTIALIELGGGFAPAELDTYFAGLGITGPHVTAVGIDGAKNVPGADAAGADGEVLLDIEVAGALSPGANIVVYFAPNTDAGFVDAVSEATHASVTPTAISISWGQNEDAWTAQARHALDQAFVDAATLGVTVTVAAGDNGSSDGASDGRNHADFPASSPHVLACGGTSLHAVSGTVQSEVVWNNGKGAGATGGGVSDVFAIPNWQASAGVPASSRGTAGRGVPDVAAVADPTTGYEVLVDGEKKIYGGTSAVAPLWAALVARLVQAAGQPFGLLHPRLYGSVSAAPKQEGFRDITSGNNGSFAAKPGWDACTGLGVPDGTALLALLTMPAH